VSGRNAGGHRCVKEVVPSAEHSSRLAGPLALLGAVAGWFGAGLADQGLGQRAFCAMVLLLLGAWIGGRLGGSPARRWNASCRMTIWVTTLCAAVVGLARLRRVHVSIACGTAISLACVFAVLALLGVVVAADRRAWRGRPGSIVSASDRRGVWVLTAATAAVLTLAALPDWPAAFAVDARAPWEVVAVGALSALVALAILVADALALLQVRAACRGRSRMERWDPALEMEPGEGVDLGLGQEARAWLERGASAYRGLERPLWVVRGDPAEARVVLRQAVGRGLVVLALVAIVLAGHAAAGM